MLDSHNARVDAAKAVVDKAVGATSEKKEAVIEENGNGNGTNGNPETEVVAAAV